MFLEIEKSEYFRIISIVKRLFINEWINNNFCLRFNKISYNGATKLGESYSKLQNLTNLYLDLS